MENNYLYKVYITYIHFDIFENVLFLPYFHYFNYKITIILLTESADGDWATILLNTSILIEKRCKKILCFFFSEENEIIFHSDGS